MPDQPDRATRDNHAVLPHRKNLPHEVPSWVPEGAVYFLTVCCAERITNTLARQEIAQALFASMRFRQEQGQWWVHLCLLMPDHLHALISFNREVRIPRMIGDWKRYLTLTQKIDWQQDFFEHRIRNDDEYSEKWSYICQNPVRAGFVTDPKVWPYVWMGHDVSDFGSAREGDSTCDQDNASR